MQQKTYTELLFTILNIIDYQNNKEKFVTDFDVLNRLDAATNIIETYPKDIQGKIRACKSVDDVSYYIAAEAYKEAYIKVTQKSLQEFIDSIKITLSANQKQRIADLIALY
jgi:hypothetical protein